MSRGYRTPGQDLIWGIIVLNLLVFVVSIPFPQIVYIFGLNPATAWDRPWTLLTSVFTHFEIWHILFNMLTFYFFGTFVLGLVGGVRLLITYLGAGILGNIFFIYMASPFSIAIGASGAIFGLGGVLAVLRPQEKVFVFPIPAPIPLWLAVVGGFLIVALAPGVAWQAHLGGIVFGLAAGYLIKRGRYYY